MPLSVGNPSGLMQSNILYCLVYCVCTWVRMEDGSLCLSVFHVAFRRSSDLGTPGEFLALHLASSGWLVQGAGRRCEGFIPWILGRHLF
jgi:hypothetical protein